MSTLGSASVITRDRLISLWFPVTKAAERRLPATFRDERRHERFVVCSIDAKLTPANGSHDLVLLIFFTLRSDFVFHCEQNHGFVDLSSSEVKREF